MRCWSTSGSFFRLVLHLNDETVQTMHKVSAAEAFCVKKKVTMKDLVDSLLRARTASLNLNLISSLLASEWPSPPATAPAPEAPPPPPPPPPAPAPASSSVSSTTTPTADELEALRLCSYRSSPSKSEMLPYKDRAAVARAAAAAEGLELVPSATGETGFRGVYKHFRKYASHIREKGQKRHLGIFETPEEAALCYARHIRADRAAREAAAVMGATSQPLTADEARAAAAAEGLELVPSATGETGFRGVYKHFRKYASHIREKGQKRHLGIFETPEEAALCYARHIRADRAAREAATVRGATPQPLTADEARAAAAAQGLELVPSSCNETGFKSVNKSGPRNYKARIIENGTMRHLGTFATPEEAALSYARSIGAERAALEAAAARGKTPQALAAGEARASLIAGRSCATHSDALQIEMEVTVPPGVHQGQHVQVQTPNGLTLVQVPPGAMPGSLFTVALPQSSSNLSGFSHLANSVSCLGQFPTIGPMGGGCGLGGGSGGAQQWGWDGRGAMPPPPPPPPPQQQQQMPYFGVGGGVSSAIPMRAADERAASELVWSAQMRGGGAKSGWGMSPLVAMQIEMEVTVPPGVQQGQHVQVQTPNGLTLVQVPPGAMPGSLFTVALPLQPTMAGFHPARLGQFPPMGSVGGWCGLGDVSGGAQQWGWDGGGMPQQHPQPPPPPPQQQQQMPYFGGGGGMSSAKSVRAADERAASELLCLSSSV